ncbi:hypothetical protein BYT27DRAFT_6547439 [Phlegmacium glaucopus]|nr:hypothetical protein BYT27DRAFT_6765398 [Phlegmacium glaucopus]KAF8808567.1 hypothetical protein BYT27DRAFT_6547439 [Phlegmacium glaucopus]
MNDSLRASPLRKLVMNAITNQGFRRAGSLLTWFNRPLFVFCIQNLESAGCPHILGFERIPSNDLERVRLRILLAKSAPFFGIIIHNQSHRLYIKPIASGIIPFPNLYMI